MFKKEEGTVYARVSIGQVASAYSRRDWERS
jgi:hypothetical protein